MVLTNFLLSVYTFTLWDHLFLHSLANKEFAFCCSILPLPKDRESYIFFFFVSIILIICTYFLVIKISNNANASDYNVNLFLCPFSRVIIINSLISTCHKFIFKHILLICVIFFLHARVNLWASQVALVVKNPPINAGDIRDMGLIPGLRRYPEGGHGNPLQYSCLENPMDRGA